MGAYDHLPGHVLNDCGPCDGPAAEPAPIPPAAPPAPAPRKVEGCQCHYCARMMVSIKGTTDPVVWYCRRCGSLIGIPSDPDASEIHWTPTWADEDQREYFEARLKAQKEADALRVKVFADIDALLAEPEQKKAE